MLIGLGSDMPGSAIDFRIVAHWFDEMCAIGLLGSNYVACSVIDVRIDVWSLRANKCTCSLSACSTGVVMADVIFVSPTT